MTKLIQGRRAKVVITNAIALALGWFGWGHFAAAKEASQPPRVEITPGMAYGVAPTVVVPLPKDRRVEISGPDLHPQVVPSPGGSVTFVTPFPESKKGK